ncbi:MAG: hypothetical protein NXI16_01805 [Alphaproteobacteria bacterium]|nr:hypothetical protein [Alphaproteobacteria bacterium]
MPDNSPKTLPGRRSALASHLRPGVFGAQCERGPLVTLSERTGLTLVQVTARAADKRKAGPAIKKVTGVSPPPKTGETRIADDGTAVHCIGPERWLIVAETAAPDAMTAALREALGNTTAAVVDLSSGRAVVRISGPKAAAVMMAATPIDLHPDVLPAPACAHTLIAQAAGLIAVFEEAEERIFELHLQRSYAGHLWEFLTETAAQYGYSVTD